MNRIPSSCALRLSRRSPGRSLVRRVTTASAVQHNEPVTFQPHPLAGAVEPSRSSRKQAVKNAKPFSEFLTDNFNRQHDYLRISVTERCNLRCLYCMPEEGVPLSPQAHLLTTPEIFYISSLFVSQGVTKIRLTGGEPTVRPDIVPLMQQIGSLRANGLRELALTTNGISLHRKLDKMVEAGLTGLNISLDTLDPFQFQILTRRKGFDAVMKSIDRVLEMNKMGAGIKLKINCVVMRGMNDREIVPFVEMGQEKDIEVRFIEYMPFDGNKWSKRKMLPYSEMLDLIREKYPGVRKVQGHYNDTSKTYEIPGFVGKLGFITSMTHNFCGSCNRLRITGDGNLKVCLFGNAEVSLRDIIRQDNNDQPIDQQAFEAIKEVEMNRIQGLVADAATPKWSEREAELLNVIGMAVKRKKEKHAGMGELENMKNRPMILIADGGKPGYNSRVPLFQSGLSRPTSTTPWTKIPNYMLPVNSAFMPQARLYSSNSRTEQGQALDSQREQSSNYLEGNVRLDDEKPQMSSSEDNGVGSTFQSLSSLFRNTLPSTGSTVHKSEQERKPDLAMPTFNPPSLTAREVLQSDIQAPDTGISVEKSNVSGHSTKHASLNDDKLDRQRLTPNMRNRSATAASTKIGPRRKQRSTEPSAVQSGSANRSNKPLPPWEVSQTSTSTSSATPPPPWKLSESLEFASSTTSLPTWNVLDRGGIDSNAPDAQRRPSSDPASASVDFADAHGQITEALSSKGTPLPRPSKTSSLTHVTSSGEAHMVDVTEKTPTNRVAVACGHVVFSNPDTSRLISENTNKKGDVLGVARIAGIMAAKRCSDLIPLCHPIAISKVTVNASLRKPGQRIPGLKNGEFQHGGVFIEARVHCFGPTGVEMEALTAVTGAALTVYDMCKAVDRSMTIDSAKVMLKTGGKSGDWTHEEWQHVQSWRNARK